MKIISKLAIILLMVMLVSSHARVDKLKADITSCESVKDYQGGLIKEYFDY